MKGIPSKHEKVRENRVQCIFVIICKIEENFPEILANMHSV